MCIKDKILNKNPKFCFNFASFEQTLDETYKFNPKKHFRLWTYHPYHQKKQRCLALFIYYNSNNSFSNSSFPTDFKFVKARQVLLKNDKTDKENYRPISILPNTSKVYEKLMYDQLYPYFNEIFLNFSMLFVKVITWSKA